MQPSPTDDCPTVVKSLVGAAFYSLQPLVLGALSMPALGYIIHRLGRDGYGQWMVATSLIACCAILTSLGLRGAFIRCIAADPSTAPKALAEQLGLRLLLTALAGLIVVSACLLLAYPPVVLWCVLVGAAGLSLTVFSTTLADLLQALHRIKTLAAISFAAGLTLTGVSVIVAWRGGGPVAMAAAYLSGPALSAALLYFIVSRQCCPVAIHWNLRRFRALLTGSRFFAAQQLLAAGSAQAEALMLPRLVGIGQFGLFTAGAMPANRLMVLPDGLCTAAYPAMSRACARGARNGSRLLVGYALIGITGGVLVALAVTILAELIGNILLADDAATFAFVARVTIWALPLVALESMMGYALNAAGKDAAQARASLPAAALSLLCSVALISVFGIPGACWSMVARPAVRAGFLAPVVWRTFRPRSHKHLETAATESAHPTALLGKAA